jgi:hypothetical protein
MNIGNRPGEDTTGIIAQQTLYHEIGFSSYIDLPVIETTK